MKRSLSALAFLGLAFVITQHAGLRAQTRSPEEAVKLALGRLDLAAFKQHIQALAQFGDREQGTERNSKAVDWIESELRRYGYTNVTRQKYTSSGRELQNIYATKMGARVPGEMYIVSAHLDGRGAGEAADDDASGCALVLELARVLAAKADIRTDRSVRFAFWNNEEFGMDGSGAYISTRNALQGTPEEPRWLGIIHHDMILFDHGLPPAENQAPEADINVEYQAASRNAEESATLARALAAANRKYNLDYPVTIGDNMSGTDSVNFVNFIPSVSVREAERVKGIVAGSNPHHHEATDLVKNYGEDDFRLGFAAAKTTLAAIAHLAGITVVPPR